MRDGPDSTELPYPWVIGTALTTAALERIAAGHGAVAFGVTPAAPFPESRAVLRSHRDNGMAGPLHFTYDDPEVASDVTLSFPWARSIVVFAHDYLATSHGPAATGPVVARFATRDQYRPVQVIADALVAELSRRGCKAEALVDDNRLVDRAAAARAGVGWIGRSTMVLSPGHGPWLLLGSVITDADLASTRAMTRTCGTCVACLPACPTGAITAEGLDARRCLATWLQAPGRMPRWVRPLVERRIYGCDDCLTSCPPGFPDLRRHRAEPAQWSFTELLACDDDALVDRFSWFYIPHRDPRFLRRNLLVAAGNTGDREELPAILDHFTHRSSLVRGHAYWAAARSQGPAAWAHLSRRHGSETVPDALDELEYALLMTRVPHGS